MTEISVELLSCLPVMTALFQLTFIWPDKFVPSLDTAMTLQAHRNLIRRLQGH